MSGIFVTIVSLSLSASAISLLILLTKPLYKKKLTKAWQYYIWLVVAARLLVPFSPEAIVPKLTFKPISAFTELAYIEPLSEPISPFIDSQESGGEIEPAGGRQITSDGYHLTATGIWNRTKPHIWVVWLAVALILLLRKIASYSIYIRRLKRGLTAVNANSAYEMACKRLKIKRPPLLYASPDTSSPMLVGLISPFLIISDCVQISEHEMEMALMHELVHCIRRDIAFKWLLQITLCIHWFNPFLWLVKREISENCEISCDEAVIERLNGREKRIYGDALLSVARSGVNSHNETMAAISASMCNEGKNLKKRLEAIMSAKRKTKNIVIISALLTAALITVSIFIGNYFGAIVSMASNANNATAQEVALGAKQEIVQEAAPPEASSSDESLMSSAPAPDVSMIDTPAPDANKLDIPASDLSLTGEDIQQIYDYVYNIRPAEADMGTRDMTEDEHFRFYTLSKAYASDAMHPQNALPFNSENGAEFWLDMQTGIYHFPSRDLTDEELLQYIDWSKKVDSALSLGYEEPISFTSDELEALISPEEAAQKAIETIQLIYGVDVSELEAQILPPTKPEHDSDPLGAYYWVGFGIENLIEVGVRYNVRVGASDGFVEFISKIDTSTVFQPRIYMSDAEEQSVATDAAWTDAAKAYVGKLHGSQNISNMRAEAVSDKPNGEEKCFVYVFITMDDGASYRISFRYSDKELRDIYCMKPGQ